MNTMAATALRVAVPVVLGYGALVLFVWLRQDRLLYHPDVARPPAKAVRALRLAFWPAEGDDYRGFVSLDAPAGARGTVVVFHGNAGGAMDRDYYVRALQPLGFRVVLAEFSGYAGRDGARRERTLLSDARETVRLAWDQFGGPIFLWGESMGCAVAAGVAANPPAPVQGVVLLTPWNNLPDLAQSTYWFLPARWLARDRYDNARALAGFRGPVAMLVAERDEVIPRAQSDRLYARLADPKRQWIFPGAGHNSWPVETDGKWWGEVMRFVAPPAVFSGKD